ncbi:hypothetical protein [Streptomyces yaizuensis]|uniref:Uncharacterized protein n=1 Tax=Streptomyces yaizuensis TaxID=2989713 RepID=A0ABQ5NXA5_9ACTN|nr:hypothetical protein [Streptomyces sp. YSPA8]GLF94995.1 hypothetical protein SYYSPA8_11880 [Streptomyces sp. YSPA8]
MEMQTWRESRARAESAARSLRRALAVAGFGEDVWRPIGPKVSRFGDARVEIGCLPADVVERMAAALRGEPDTGATGPPEPAD